MCLIRPFRWPAEGERPRCCTSMMSVVVVLNLEDVERWVERGERLDHRWGRVRREGWLCRQQRAITGQDDDVNAQCAWRERVEAGTAEGLCSRPAR